MGSPFTKYKLYNNLGGFLDSSRQAQAQIPEIYDTALEHYGENRFSAAMEWLEIIPDYENYEDAFVYVEACKAHTVLSENYYKMTREVQNALEMLEWSDQYIDVEPICMDRYLIDYFLDGTWVAVDGDVFEYAMENNEFDFWYRYVPSGKYNFESDGMYYASSGTRFAAWDYISYNEIGREGRNIRALEAATGVEIVVDDTPEAIVLSAFDPVRREIARLALHQLVTDGRIHPARIEEVVAKVRKQVEDEIIETGKRTTIDLGIHGLHPELIRIIGKMKYRSSYGQNLLQHARETANLCAVMASELGLNPKKAKRAGLLHDIGKVPDEEPELPHALLGMKLAEKYKEKADICNAIGAHHDEVEMASLLAPIVQVCDAISGARPGARREIVEAYIKRLNDLEQLAMSYPGVTKTYAIQAGRELRVIVGADKIDDKQTESLSTEIAKKIQDEMTYPGQVKITVIRETRAVSFAK